MRLMGRIRCYEGPARFVKLRPPRARTGECDLMKPNSSGSTDTQTRSLVNYSEQSDGKSLTQEELNLIRGFVRRVDVLDITYEI